MQRLLLVGGGHASIEVLRQARAWPDGLAEITLLSDRPTLWYSGMTPEHLGGVYTREEVALDLARLCREAGIRFVQGRAVALDADHRRVTTDDGRTFEADIIAFDIGGVNPAKQVAEGDAILTKPLHRIEALSSWLDELALHGRSGHLVVVGGGAVGVEVAMNVHARLGPPLALTLVEPTDRILPGFPAHIAARARELLHGYGAHLLLGQSADRVDDGAVVLQDGQRLPADAVLWATGTAGATLFREAGLDCSEKGFLRIDQTLRARPWLFAAGDCAAVEGHEDLARVGVYAVQQGPVLAHNLRAALSGHGDLRPFRPYPVAPLILSTGQREGLLVAGRLGGRGAWALRLKHWADLRWQNGYLPPEQQWPLAEVLHARSASSSSAAPSP